MLKTGIPCVVAVCLTSVVVTAGAATPRDILSSYEAQVRAQDPTFAGFSADRGERFFTTVHGGGWSCASCHGERPIKSGRHARTGRDIAPLAPSANPQRFSDTAKVEKWFRRNCNDLLGRACTGLEKGDVVSWLLNVR